MVGDINLPGIDWREKKSDSKGKPVLETMEEEGLEQLIMFPTHKKGNVLDLVVTNYQEKIVGVNEAGRLGRSDHSIIVIEMLVDCKDDGEHIRRPDWRRANYEGMKLELELINWQQTLAVQYRPPSDTHVCIG